MVEGGPGDEALEAAAEGGGDGAAEMVGVGTSSGVGPEALAAVAGAGSCLGCVGEPELLQGGVAQTGPKL